MTDEKSNNHQTPASAKAKADGNKRKTPAAKSKAATKKKKAVARKPASKKTATQKPVKKEVARKKAARKKAVAKRATATKTATAPKSSIASQGKVNSGKPRRALVLGCGAVAGAAWSTAILDELRKQMNWEPHTADIIIGTSAGAVLATLLGAGVTVSQLMECQQGTASNCNWNHDTDSGGNLPGVPAWQATAPKLALRWASGHATPISAICGLLPTGQADMSGFTRLIKNVVPDNTWVQHPATWIIAVDTETGERVPFGKQGAPQAAISDAVCASYGVPGVCPPVHIGTAKYIDGGVASPASADLLVHSDVDEVIVLAPMSSSYPDQPRSPLARFERLARKTMTAILDEEVALLRATGKKVIRLEPGSQDLQAFGFNMMDTRRRTTVFNTALKTAPDLVNSAIYQSTI